MFNKKEDAITVQIFHKTLEKKKNCSDRNTSFVAMGDIEGQWINSKWTQELFRL